VGSAAVAAVSSEHDTRLLGVGEVASFGRDPAASLRIGAAPLHDAGVPRLAGRVVAVDGRVVVENLDETHCLTVTVAGRGAVTVPPGGHDAPEARSFDVAVEGDVGTYVVSVTVDARRLPPKVRLPAEQRRVLDAYVGGHGADAGVAPTHEQVAERLGITAAAARAECQRIVGELRLAGIELRDLGDPRDVVVDAWRRQPF
jgi:hypothetical protein